jgi:tRNA (cytidine/uridine-2'-O-)-methyltransferase
MAFALSDARLRRAGLDYHEWARVRQYANLADCLAALGSPRLFAFSTRGTSPLAQAGFVAGDALLFGAETSGLPADVLASIPAPQVLRIPMRPNNRSLNLSNAVAIVVYEAWRQQQYAGAC